jgi:hypothetical protein
VPTLVCGYDEINYDESFYDCEDLADVECVLSFAWGLTPLPEEDCMSSQVSYELNLQGTDPQSLIKTQADVSDTVPLANDVLSDDTYNIDSGAIDYPLHVIDADIDVLAIIPTGGNISVKINGITGTPFTIKKLMFLDGEGVSSVYVSNPNTQSVKVRAIMAARD